MADRDLHELLDLALPAQLTAGGMSGGPGMRWHPDQIRARPAIADGYATGVPERARPQPIVLHINPAFVAACRQLNDAVAQAYAAMSAAPIQEFARMINAPKERR